MVFNLNDFGLWFELQNSMSYSCDTSQTKELSQSSTHALSMLPDISKSDHILPNNLPNPNSVTDTITVDEEGHLGDEMENEEMTPLEDIDD